MDFDDASVLHKGNRNHPMFFDVKAKMGADGWKNFENIIEEILNEKYKKPDGKYSLAGEAFICTASK
jgi:hypothetical protein